MRLNSSSEKRAAMTAFEVLVVVVCVTVFAILLLPMFAPNIKHGGPVSCVCNLMQIDIAFRIWANDNNDQFPTTVSVTNGGAMELVQSGNLVGCLQIMSNELTTTKILVCPNDPARTFATNWLALNRSHISYFIDADPSNRAEPNFILAGDDNLEINGALAGSGSADLSSNALIEWASGHHSRVYKPHFWSLPKTNGFGNLVFADGHIGRESSHGLQQAFQGTGFATNRIVIP